MGGRGFLQGFILERCFWLDLKNSLYRLFQADERKIHTSCQKWPILSYIGLDKVVQAHHGAIILIKRLIYRLSQYLVRRLRPKGRGFLIMVLAKDRLSSQLRISYVPLSMTSK